MPIIKIYGATSDSVYEQNEMIFQKIDAKMKSVFGQEEVEIVIVLSEGYRYLEIIFTYSSEKGKIINALKQLHLGISVVLLHHDRGGYIPASEMI